MSIPDILKITVEFPFCNHDTDTDTCQKVGYSIHVSIHVLLMLKSRIMCALIAGPKGPS